MHVKYKHAFTRRYVDALSDAHNAANLYFRSTPYTQCTWGVRQPRAGRRRAWQSLNELLAIIAVAAEAEAWFFLSLSLASLDGLRCNLIPEAAVTRWRRLSYSGLARDGTYCCYACSVGQAARSFRAQKNMLSSSAPIHICSQSRKSTYTYESNRVAPQNRVIYAVFLILHACIRYLKIKINRLMSTNTVLQCSQINIAAEHRLCNTRKVIPHWKWNDKTYELSRLQRVWKCVTESRFAINSRQLGIHIGEIHLVIGAARARNAAIN